jgi:UDP-2,3-diacylglucosamine hydrolase
MTIERGAIFVIGDSHIGLKDGDEKKMVAWIDRLRELAPSALYLNGDLFHYYIGSRKFITSSVERVFGKFRELRDSGVEVHYVEGNRDFFLRGSLAERCVSSVTLRSEIYASGRRYLIVHGDMINDRDLPYRFWRRASKNIVTRLGVGLVPTKIARKFVDVVEKKLADTNFKHKQRLPVELMEQYGRHEAKAGIDVVVFGHFHQKLVLPAGDATVTILPPWFEEGEAMVISPTTGEFQFAAV